MNLRNFEINLSTFFSLKDKKISVEKAYTEGIYADTPANRKLGRVGMSYADWEKKQGKKEEKIDSISLYRLGRVLEDSEIYPMSIKDHGDYFLISLEKSDFKNKKYLKKTKDVLKDLGAKIYIPKDTHFIKAYKKDITIKKGKKELFNIGNLEFDINARTLTNDKGEQINLTPKESEVLETLASNPNQIVSRNGLLEKIWGESNYYNSRSLDVYITKLREKLSGDENIEIKTVHWQGFKLLVKDKDKEAQNKIKNIISQTETFKNAEGKKLDAIIEYSNSVEGVPGIQVKEGATDKEKREAIADFYINNAELEGENSQIANDLDEIVEDAIADYVPKKEEKKEDKESVKNKETLKKINNYFGFEDENAEWFADTPIALTMSDDKEFGEVIEKFTDYQIIGQSGSYKNDGSRANMLGCNVEYEIVPKGTADEDIEDNKETFIIDNKTTIKNILEELK